MMTRQGVGGLLLASVFAFLTPFAAATPTRFDVTSVNLSASDIAFNAATGEWIVAVSAYGLHGPKNTINRVSANGTLLKSTFVGGDPGVLELSKDGSLGYVGFQGAGIIQSFDAVTGTLLTQFSTGLGKAGISYTEDIAVSPTDKNVIAVSRYTNLLSPRHDGVVIFKDGVALPNQTNRFTNPNLIEFGSDGSTLYGYNNETSANEFSTMRVDESGVTTTSVKYGTFYWYTNTFQYDGGLVFSNSEVADAPTGVKKGEFPFLSYSGSFVASVEAGEGYFLSNSGDLTIFDLGTLAPKASYALGIPATGGGSFTKLTLGANGSLAAIMGRSQVYLLTATAVPEPGSAALLLLGLAGLALHRSSKRA